MVLIFSVSALTFAQEKPKHKLQEITDLSLEIEESGLCLDPLNKNLYFSRMNKEGNYDVHRALYNHETEKWKEDKSWDWPFNNSLDNSIMHISKNGEFYFQKGISDDEKGKMIYGIFKTKLENGKWSEAQKQKIEYFKNHSKDQSFCISSDQNIMILSIQSHFSYGVEDLYVSFRKDENNWTEPKNLGSTLNTPYEEFTPYLAEDNRTLYFSSNGIEGGRGSKDIWMSYRIDESWTNWTKPINLGNEINTSGMETNFRKTGIENKPYILCSSINSMGQADIYLARIEESTIDSILNLIRTEPELVEIPLNNDSIVEDSTNSSIEVLEMDSMNIFKADVFSKNSGLKISSTIIIESRSGIDTVQLDVDSVYKFNPIWNDTLDIKVSADDFIPQKRSVIFDNQRFGLALTEEFYLDSLELNKIFQLKNVLFKRGTSQLLENSFGTLDLVDDILSINSEIQIEIAGHTDNSGNAFLNQRLSEQRANAIKQYLIKSGINPDRISTVGYGGSKPIASNDNEETMKLNRRVEFKLYQRK